MTIPQIEIDIDKACSKCGRKGATQCGLCLRCVANNIRRVTPVAREYVISKRIQDIAERLIDEHHPHLKAARIAYLMKERDPEAKLKPPKDARGGKKPIAATARLVSKLYGALTDYDFIIDVDEIPWDRLNLEQQEAFIDHELCHFARDENGWYVRDHDVEEFREILEWHGFWKYELEEFVSAAPEQQELPFAKSAVNR